MRVNVCLTVCLFEFVSPPLSLFRGIKFGSLSPRQKRAQTVLPKVRPLPEATPLPVRVCERRAQHTQRAQAQASKQTDRQTEDSFV